MLKLYGKYTLLLLYFITYSTTVIFWSYYSILCNVQSFIFIQKFCKWNYKEVVDGRIFWCFHLFVNCGDFCGDFSESGVKLVAIHWNSHMLSERTDWFIDVWKAMLYSWQLCAVSKFAKLNEMNQQRFDQSISITMSRYVCDTTTVLARGSYMRDPMHNAAVALLHLHSRACALFCSLIFLS